MSFFHAKRFVIFGVFLYLLLLTVKPASAATKNVLTNPDFEEATLQWDKKTTPDGLIDRFLSGLKLKKSDVDISTNTDEKYSYFNKQSAKINATKGLGITQDATISPDKPFFANANVLITKGEVQLIINDKHSGKELQSLVKLANTNWQRLGISIPAHEVSSNVTYEIIALTDDTEFYADNLVLHELESIPLPSEKKFNDIHEPTFLYKGKPVKQHDGTKVLGDNTYSLSTPLTPVPKIYPMKVLLAAQVDTSFGTPDNIIQKLNDNFALSSINKTFSGTVEVYDQTIPTNCQISTYSTPKYVPDEFCGPTSYSGNSILLAIPHGQYDGFASYPGKAFSSDLVGYTNRYFVALHELGHVIGFNAHYDDVYKAFDETNRIDPYQSPFTNSDIMGYGQEKFQIHSQNIINRSPYLSGIGAALNYENYPLQIKLLDPDNKPFQGEITVYPAVGRDQHQASVTKETVYQPTQVVGGILNYKEMGQLPLSLLKIQNGSETAYKWLDGSLVQQAFWENRNISLEVPIKTGPPQIIPTPTQSPTPQGEILLAEYDTTYKLYKFNPYTKDPPELFKQSYISAGGGILHPTQPLLLYPHNASIIVENLLTKDEKIIPFSTNIYLQTLRLSPDGSTMYVSAVGQTNDNPSYYAVNLQTGQIQTLFMKSNTYTRFIRVTPQNTLLYVQSSDDQSGSWDLHEFNPQTSADSVLVTLPPNSNYYNVTNDKSRVYYVINNSIYVYLLATKEIQWIYTDPSYSIQYLALSPDEQKFLLSIYVFQIGRSKYELKTVSIQDPSVTESFGTSYLVPVENGWYASIPTSPYNPTNDKVCPAQTTLAQNYQTSECKTFANACDIPIDWGIVTSCVQPSPTNPLTGPQPSITLRNGDVNQDGKVDLSDIKYVLSNWLSILTNSVDQYGDSRINALDFVRVLKQIPPLTTPL